MAVVFRCCLAARTRRLILMSFLQRFRKIRSRHSRDYTLLAAVLLVVAIILVGTAGYTLIEGWTPTEALYATVITVTTVGYGDLVPTTEGGRLFAIVFTLFAIGAVGYTLTALAAGIIETAQSRREALLQKKQKKRVAELDDHIIICGGGYVGKRIAHELAKEGKPFIVIEPHEDLMRWTLLYLDEEYRRHRFRETHDLTYQMEESGHEEMALAPLAEELDIAYILDTPTSNAVLASAGIGRASGLFAAMNDDRDNLLVVLSARGLARETGNEKLRIIARTSDEELTLKLRMAGADHVFSPNIVEAVQLTAHMLHPHTGAFWRMSMDENNPLRFTEVIVDELSGLAGKSCAEIKLSERYLVMSIFRDKQYLNLPDPDQRCRNGDVLVVVTNER